MSEQYLRREIACGQLESARRWVGPAPGAPVAHSQPRRPRTSAALTGVARSEGPAVGARRRPQHLEEVVAHHGCGAEAGLLRHLLESLIRLLEKLLGAQDAL